MPSWEQARENRRDPTLYEEQLETEWEGENLDWDYTGDSGTRLEATPGRTLEDAGPRSPGGAEGTSGAAEPVLGDADILAAEALLDKRLLAVLLALGSKPRQAGELARSLRVLVPVRVRVRKRVHERDPSGWGYREVEREVEEERWEPRPIPQSTLYRLLGRLKRAGLVEEYRGLDARRRYYRLTGLGHQVYERVRAHILRALEARANEGVVAWQDYEEIARGLGQPPEKLASILGLRVTKTYGERHVHLPGKNK